MNISLNALLRHGAAIHANLSVIPTMIAWVWLLSIMPVKSRRIGFEDYSIEVGINIWRGSGLYPFACLLFIKCLVFNSR